MIHKLKILPEFFPLVEKGKKRFELRKNDRNYQEDDILLLKKINVPIEILMEIERPEVIIVEDTKQLGEGTAALPPPPNPWASKNRKQTDDSDNDGQ